VTAPQRDVKHRQVFATLRREIQTGHWKSGERLPSESELVARFKVSRITITRAVRDLQNAGMVERRAGAGTFVRQPSESPHGLTFGLLIPELGETDVFEPICQGMMASPLAREHALIWGSASGQGVSKERAAWQLCEQYIDRRVSGVFFAPLEGTPDANVWNGRIGEALDRARIPLVLLDRTVTPYPEPGRYDLVGIDNRRAGFVATAHLLRGGCRRVAFVAAPNAASTIDARTAGHREALFTFGVPMDDRLIARFDPEDSDAVSSLMRAHPEGILAGNDRTAARLLATLGRAGHRVPQDVRLVGIDDVEYARLLPVPLTTLRQPTREIGDAALSTMLARVARRDMPPRHIYLDAELVVRASCGLSRSGAR
jgi:GntR family transcriptional regulator of arabinose operon